MSQTSKPTDDGNDTLDLGALLRILWRGKWIIALLTGLALILGFYYAYFRTTPVFTASSVVIMESRTEQVLDLETVVSGLSSDSSVITSEVEVLKSRTLIGTVVDRMDLTKDPEFNPLLRSPSLRQRTVRAIRALFGSQPMDPSSYMTEEELKKRERDLTINGVLRALTIRNIPNSLVFDIRAVTQSPRKSALLADALVEAYIDDQIRVKFEKTDQAVSWLTDRVATLQSELETTEARLKDFNGSTDLISQEVLLGMERQLKDLRTRIENGVNSIQALEAKLAAVQNTDNLAEQARLLQDDTLTALIARNDGAAAENATTRVALLTRNLSADLVRIRNQQATLERSRDTLAAQVEQQSKDLITQQQLTREAEASRLLYEYFLSRLKETSAQEGIQQADSRQLSPAVMPSQPSAPNKPAIVGMSGILGFVLGCALIFFREFRLSTFRTARDLERKTGYTVMGQIPRVPSKSRKNVIGYLAERPTSAAAEAVRNLRTSVLLSNIDHPPQIIGTTSSLPGEGKTTTALSLAQNFAGLGRKVLLIEGDVRRRIFGQYMDSSQEQGLIAVLSGEARLQDVLLHDETVGADILIADKAKANPADIFTSTRFAELLSATRETYDTIIIDTPPVLIVPDARIIAQHVDAMLFVVAWDRTSTPQVSEALHMFESVGQKVAGLVLNQVDEKGMKRYGYGGAYGSYAAYGERYYNN